MLQATDLVVHHPVDGPARVPRTASWAESAVDRAAFGQTNASSIRRYGWAERVKALNPLALFTGDGSYTVPLSGRWPRWVITS